MAFPKRESHRYPLILLFIIVGGTRFGVDGLPGLMESNQQPVVGRTSSVDQHGGFVLR